MTYLPFSGRKKLSKPTKYLLILEIFYSCECHRFFLSDVNHLSPVGNLKRSGINQTILQKILIKKFQTKSINRTELKEILQDLLDLGMIRVVNRAQGGREIFYWITKKGIEVFKPSVIIPL